MNTVPRFALALLLGVLAAMSAGRAQEATERFIPIGQSPGLSGTHTIIGEIQSFDGEARTLTVATADRTYDVAVTAQTRIWIDRSRQALPALTGTFADCQRGLQVEVKLQEDEKRAADWIKVRSAAR